MKNIFFLLCCFLLTFQSKAQTREHKALFVIADGIPADVIEKLATPNLHAIAKDGAWLHAYVGGERDGYSQTPTISAVGYNSLLTGTWVNKHNVWDNDIAAPNYAYWTIFRFFKSQYPAKKTAIFSTWLDNRTKLVGDELPQTGSLKIDEHFDGLELDTVQYPHDKESEYTHRIDEAVISHAATAIRETAPDLTWVYLEFTDDMGHRYGDSKKMYDAVEMMDAQVGALWKAIQYRQENFKEDWQIYITTDHGRDPKTGRGHGGQSDRERNTWIVTNAKVNPWFRDNPPGIVSIMPSIAQHLQVKIPRPQAMEIDGSALTGKISASDLKATLTNQQLTVTWKAIDKKQKAKIWIATTNGFKTGTPDEYRLLKQTTPGKEKETIDLRSLPASNFYKVVLETKDNFLNYWINIK